MTYTIENFDLLWDFGNPAETEKRFRDLLPEVNDHDFHVQLLTQIARTHSLRRNFDDAHRLLDEAKSMMDSRNETHPQTAMRYLLERGRAYNSAGALESARPLFVEAWETGLSSNEPYYAVDAAHMIAIVEGDSDESLGWNYKAMELAERSGDEKAAKWLGALYNNIGVNHLNRKEYDKSLEAYQKGLDWRVARNAPISTIRIARWTVARALRGLGRLEEALQIQRELEAEFGEEQDGYVFEEIAECLTELEREEEARPYFAKAFELLSKDAWFAQKESERLERLARKGAIGATAQS